jgi:hypothetical protein
MRLLRAWFLRLGGLFNRARRERELADELESHLQLHIEDNLRAGMTPIEARRQALLKLGGVEQTKEIYRDRRGLPILESLIQDVRYGLRMLAKSPGFTAVAVLTLALGIGANTAIFTLIDALLLKRLPVREPDRLVALSEPDRRDKESGWYSYAEYAELRDHNDVLTGLAATMSRWMTLGWNGVTEQMPAAWVSGNYFDVLGVKAFLGRTFVPEDERSGNAIVVLRYDLWKQFFGGDPAVVGRTIEVFHRPFTVIGVLPPGFNGLGVRDRKLSDSDHHDKEDVGLGFVESIRVARAPAVRPFEGWRFARAGTGYDGGLVRPHSRIVREPRQMGAGAVSQVVSGEPNHGASRSHGVA